MGSFATRFAGDSCCARGTPVKTTAIAHANIALVKYWGKRAGTAPELNLPAVGSLSITLGGLSTETTAELAPDLAEDDFCMLDAAGEPLPPDPRMVRRVRAFLDLVRDRAGGGSRLRVVSRNDFPTGAGLASSASGFAALALAGTRALGADLPPGELSSLARCGSGSAARSVFGGFVELERGTAEDGHDCVARPLAAPDHWPLRVVVAVTTEQHKAIGSTAGMQRTAETSPFFAAWVESHPADLAAARDAIAARDFDRLAAVTELSCLSMHGLMLSARPGLVYWNAATVELIHSVRAWRAAGVPCCFTIDAGPQVKVVCEASVADEVRARLTEVPGVLRTIESGLGQEARSV